jgi:hypothetical protein
LDFREKKELTRYENGEDRSEQVFGLLIGKKAIAEYYNKIDYGTWCNKLYPAWFEGKKCWMESSQWEPSFGYCADRRNQRILKFDDGVKILMREGCFEHLWAPPENK